MTTNLDVITQAAYLANLITDGQPLSARQASRGLDLLNDMLLDWDEAGIELGYFPQTDTSADFPVDSTFFRAVKYSLSVEIAAAYQLPVSNAAAKVAGDSYANLMSISLEEVETDMSQLPYGEVLRRQGLDIDE